MMIYLVYSILLLHKNPSRPNINEHLDSQHR